MSETRRHRSGRPPSSISSTSSRIGRWFGVSVALGAVLLSGLLAPIGPTPANVPHGRFMAGPPPEFGPPPSPILAASVPRPSAPSPFDDWSTYGGSPERSGFNPAETALTPGDASRLQQVWNTEVNDTILGSAIVVNETLYVGDRLGYLSAINATSGSLETPTSASPWATPFLGNESYTRCSSSNPQGVKKVGLLDTPALVGNRLYVSGGNTSFFTLSTTGQVLQRVDVANHSAAASNWRDDYLWASPLIYRGYAYVGTGAFCEFNGGDPNSSHWKYIQGQLVQVNLTSGNVTAVWNATKGASVTDLGGSIWSTPAVDPQTNTVWVTTGNMNSSGETPTNGEYPQSVVALNATTLAFRGGCQVAAGAYDADYGAGPTLFWDPQGGRYVGAINKDGTFSAYNATNPGTGTCGTSGTGHLTLAWADAFCAGTTPGTISPAAFDGRYLYIASDGCTNNSGFVDQVYPSNGTVRWHHSMYSPPAQAHAGIAVADGLVVVAANNMSSGNVGNGVLQVLNASDGDLLYQHEFVGETNAWPVVAEGTIYVTVGNATFTDPGWVSAFRVPLAPSLGVTDATCYGTPISGCNATGEYLNASLTASGGAPPFSCAWTLGDGATNMNCTVSHRYAVGGTYPVNATLRDRSGAARSFRLNVTIPPRSAPPLIASLVGFPASGDAGRPYLFAANATGGRSPVTYSWNFGDSATNVTGNPVAHAYRASGLYPVTVTARDSSGNRSSATQAIRINPALALAALPPIPPTDAGQLVGVTANVTGGTPPLAVTCRFGDGTEVRANPTRPLLAPVVFSHAYLAAGNWTVTVWANDSAGGNVTSSAVLRVNGSLVITDFALPVAPTAGSSARFSANFSGGSPPYQVLWSFGDGAELAAPDALHYYSQPGNYTVTFRVTDVTRANVSESALLEVKVHPAGVPYRPVAPARPPVWLYDGIAAAAAGVTVAVIVWARRCALRKSGSGPL